MPEFASQKDVDAYIQRAFPGSTITAEMLQNASLEQGIAPELLLALVQHESYIGTSNVALSNNNPGGVTWFDFLGLPKGTSRPGVEGGNYVSFPTMEQGLGYVASLIGNRRIDASQLKDDLSGLSSLAKQVVESPELLAGFTPSKRFDIRKELADAGIDIPEVLSFEDKMEYQKDLKKDFNTVAKDTRKAVNQIDLMNTSFEALIADPENEDKLNAASQGILVVFQKMLDPTSVVRESEYARSGTGLSLAGRIQGFMKKLEAGGAGLTTNDLKQFVEMGNTYFENVYRPSLVDEATLIKDIADKYNLDTELILTRSVLDMLEEVGLENVVEEELTPEQEYQLYLETLNQ